jgi:hypothetical protein
MFILGGYMRSNIVTGLLLLTGVILISLKMVLIGVLFLFLGLAV